MSKPFIFVSCGQYTQAEKSLGKAICNMVKSFTGLDAFFAEQVQDLNGLDSNILAALRDCSAFITVLHPRGMLLRPDGSQHIRASVWIEQEIAIATYIQRLEKRPLPVIAFVHESVGREGIRDLLHLNPIQFRDDAEVLATLPEHLENWKGLASREENSVLIDQRRQVENKIRNLSKEHTEALYIVARDGSSTDGHVLSELHKKGMAANWVSVLEGLSRNTNFVFQGPGQADRMIRPEAKVWTINTELRRLILDYFSRNNLVS